MLIKEDITRTLLRTTYHFLACLRLGGGFLGIKNKALIGCISQSATKKHKHTDNRQYKS